MGYEHSVNLGHYMTVFIVAYLYRLYSLKFDPLFTPLVRAKQLEQNLIFLHLSQEWTSWQLIFLKIGYLLLILLSGINSSSSKNTLRILLFSSYTYEIISEPTSLSCFTLEKIYSGCVTFSYALDRDWSMIQMIKLSKFMILEYKNVSLRNGTLRNKLRGCLKKKKKLYFLLRNTEIQQLNEFKRKKHSGLLNQTMTYIQKDVNNTKAIKVLCKE